jgi:hypothetical protein
MGIVPMDLSVSYTLYVRLLMIVTDGNRQWLDGLKPANVFSFITYEFVSSAIRETNAQKFDRAHPLLN